jgi:hypothetical protein
VLRRLAVGFLTLVVLVLAWFLIANAIWPPIAPDGKQLSPVGNILRALAYGSASAFLLGVAVWRRAIRDRLSERSRLATAVATYRDHRR